MKKTYKYKKACVNCHTTTEFDILIGVIANEFIIDKLCPNCKCNICGLLTDKQFKETFKEPDGLEYLPEWEGYMNIHWKKFLDEFDEISSMNEDWSLKNSGIYFRNIKESLKSCKNLDEIKGTLSCVMDPGLRNIRLRISAVIEDAINTLNIQFSTGCKK